MSTETKELVIEAHIPLPEDYLEEVKVAGKVTAAADAFRDNLTEALGDGFKVFVTRATPTPPKAPRAPRSPNGTRKPRTTAAAANGADTTTAPAQA